MSVRKILNRVYFEVGVGIRGTVNWVGHVRGKERLIIIMLGEVE